MYATNRPAWANKNDLLRDYYDNEWGEPVFSEQGIFERISLEVFQAGLSWRTVLEKREAFRRHFDDFDPELVADFDELDVERILADPEVIRNRQKVSAVINNARATLRLREEEPLPQLVWSFRPERTPAPRKIDEIPTESPESFALSKRLKKCGFKFVGPRTMYALMQAIGMVDDHLVGSPRRGTSGIFDVDGGAVDISGRLAAGQGAQNRGL